MKTEFYLYPVLKVLVPLITTEKVSNKYNQPSDFIAKGTIPKGYILYNHNCIFISPIYTLPWREHNCLHAKSRYKWGKVLSSYYLSKEKMPNLAGNKHPTTHFLLYGPRLFHLSTEKVRVRSAENGHQNGYSRADTINKNINGR